jgi:hypothetical protein
MRLQQLFRALDALNLVLSIAYPMQKFLARRKNAKANRPTYLLPHRAKTCGEHVLWVIVMALFFWSLPFQVIASPIVPVFVLAVIVLIQRFLYGSLLQALNSVLLLLGLFVGWMALLEIDRTGGMLAPHFLGAAVSVTLARLTSRIWAGELLKNIQ